MWADEGQSADPQIAASTSGLGHHLHGRRPDHLAVPLVGYLLPRPGGVFFDHGQQRPTTCSVPVVLGNIDGGIKSQLLPRRTLPGRS